MPQFHAELLTHGGVFPLQHLYIAKLLSDIMLARVVVNPSKANVSNGLLTAIRFYVG